MKKYFCIGLNLLLLVCFTFFQRAWAGNTTISIDIYEIKVNCNTRAGYFIINDNQYTGNQSFFRRKGDSINISVQPNAGYELTGISSNISGKVVIDSNSVCIDDLQANVQIDLKFSLIGGSNESNSEINTSQNSSDVKICDGGEKCPIKHFIDIDTSSWYHLDTDYVVENGLMNGITNETFEPHSPTTRAMIVTILFRLEGKPNVKYIDIFDDVEREAWYTDAIIWANENGIVLGYGDGNFGPSDMVTREQMVTILHRYAKYKNYKIENKSESIFSDFRDGESVSDWAKIPMKWACEVGIIKGVDTMLMPRNSTERCQLAAILHRFCENIVK